MRYLLILIPCFFLPLLQEGQGKKPSLPPLTEAEVPSPPGVQPKDTGSQPGKAATSQPEKAGKTKPTNQEKVTDSPTSRPGIGKVQRSLMGVWRVLPTASLGGNARRSIKGYLIITKAHLSFQLIQEGRGDQASFQTGIRTYSILGDQIITNALQGIRNGKKAGNLLLDPVGLREFRKFVLLAPNVLRLIQVRGQILEFQRVEQL